MYNPKGDLRSDLAINIIYIPHLWAPRVGIRAAHERALRPLTFPKVMQDAESIGSKPGTPVLPADDVGIAMCMCTGVIYQRLLLLFWGRLQQRTLKRDQTNYKQDSSSI